MTFDTVVRQSVLSAPGTIESAGMTQRRRWAAAAQWFLAVAFFGAYVLAASAVSARRVCPGDMNGDGQTTPDEVVAATAAALHGCAAAPLCPGDLNGDGQTTVDEVVSVVNAALNGCGPKPVSASSAVAKVKNLLVGLPPTDAEVEAVATDQSALYGLVGQWMALPQYDDKMLRFFITQFQQDRFDFIDLSFQFDVNTPFTLDIPAFVQDVQQSFGRTIMELIAEGEPFTSAMTTTRFMMTPALMAAYAVLDSSHVDDGFFPLDLFQRDHPSSVTLESSTPIPIEESSDPTSPNFLTFYDPTIATPYAAGCPSGTIVYPAPVTYDVIANFLFDYTPARFGPQHCAPPLDYPRSATYIRSSDFTTWRMITIRQPQAGEPTTQMYDLPAMRAGHDLVLNIPRVGFFTTPAFGARWLTNADNQARVLINQTLIVALGQPIDFTNTTAPPSLAALNEAHAAPGTACYACHQALDPMRQFFRQTYTLYFSQQLDPVQLAMNGQFAFHGVSAEGTHISDLGRLLAAHPMFATAWVQKLCTYATSEVCDEDDPEFTRLVDVFTGSNFNWNALVQALFSSPLVTYLQETQTTDNVGQSFPIARLAHLCATLSNRLGVSDLCGLDVNTPLLGSVPSGPSGNRAGQVVRAVAASWPSDQYSRGSATPSLASDPSLLMRGGMENLCADLAGYFVDNRMRPMFQSTDSTAAIENLVTQLMGLTSDRAAGPRAILQDHFAAAVQQGASASEALQSTFVLACLSPYVVGVGQ